MCLGISSKFNVSEELIVYQVVSLLEVWKGSKISFNVQAANITNPYLLLDIEGPIQIEGSEGGVRCYSIMIQLT